MISDAILGEVDEQGARLLRPADPYRAIWKCEVPELFDSRLERSFGSAKDQ